jgi:hypothetical protein
MIVYLGKQQQHATAQTTATRLNVLQAIRIVQGLGEKFLMGNYFTSPALFKHL